jgi:hypothetical protein
LHQQSCTDTSLWVERRPQSGRESDADRTPRARRMAVEGNAGFRPFRGGARAISATPVIADKHAGESVRVGEPDGRLLCPSTTRTSHWPAPMSWEVPVRLRISIVVTGLVLAGCNANEEVNLSSRTARGLRRSLSGTLGAAAAAIEAAPADFLFLARWVCYAQCGVDRLASRHAGPALPASTSLLSARGSAAMVKPLTDNLATALAARPRPESLRRSWSLTSSATPDPTQRTLADLSAWTLALSLVSE